MTKSSDNTAMGTSKKVVETLIHELLAAQKELVMRNTNKGGEQPACFIIAKLVSSVDKDTWEQVRAQSLPEGWHALELDAKSAFAKMAKKGSQDYSSSQVMEHLLLAASFFKQLEQEIVRAKRSATSLALVYFGMQNAGANRMNLEDATRLLHDALKAHGADCDTLGILDTESFALILPGAKAFKAQSIVEDILAYCQGKNLALRAGIAVHQGADCTVANFLEHAHMALLEGQKEQKHLCVYKKPSQSPEDSQALVHGHEKLFLFGKSDEV